jgi:hypothetical protein
MSAACRIRTFSSALALLASGTAISAGIAQQPPAKSRSVPHKDPELATILGIVIPGGGQFYADRYGKGLIVLGGTAAGTAIAIDAAHNQCNGHSCSNSGLQAVGIVGAALAWGYGWVTASRDVRRRNDQMLTGTSFAPFLDRRNGRLLAGLTFDTR